MLVHHYDRDTFFYLSSTNEGYESPLERGVYIVPGSSTVIAPPSHGRDGVKYRFDEKNNRWQEYVVSTAMHLRRLREMRNSLLAQTDYLCLPDYPLRRTTREEWYAYRQALRDLPHTTPDVLDVKWPAPPTTSLTRDAL